MVKPAKKALWSTRESNFPYEVVNGDELRRIIDKWEEEWSTSRPVWSGKGKYAVTYLTPTRLILEKTGMEEPTLWSIRRSHGPDVRKWIGVQTADRILTAIGLHHYLYDGTLQVVPNPQITAERYQEWLSSKGCA